MDRLSDYDYELPEDRIAQTPLEDRAGSKLLVLPRDGGAVEHRTFRDVRSILRRGDLLVLNDTRVTALRLLGQKPTGGQVEVLLLRDHGEGLFDAMVRPGRRLKPGVRVVFAGGLEAEIGEAGEGPIRSVQFLSASDLEERIRAHGRTPLPPYIHAALADPERYQTVYARTGGSAAAPTAGLHFTPDLLNELREMGVETAMVTLDVSLDTFRPVEVEDLDSHVMHGEAASVPEESAEKIAACSGRVIAAGTTVVRTLESFANGPRTVRTGSASTKLFIRPGYAFQVVDGMFTNFHLPRTTMMVLVSALVGRERLLAAYAEALAADYRFLSFGDSMLVI